MKLEALAKHIMENKKDLHNKEVEYIIVTKDDGQIVTMDMAKQAGAVVKALKLFTK